MTKKALQVIVSVFMDDKQPASLRLAAANDLLDRAYGKPPQAIAAHVQQTKRILGGALDAARSERSFEGRRTRV